MNAAEGAFGPLGLESPFVSKGMPAFAHGLPAASFAAAYRGSIVARLCATLDGLWLKKTHCFRHIS